MYLLHWLLSLVIQCANKEAHMFLCDINFLLLELFLYHWLPLWSIVFYFMYFQALFWMGGAHDDPRPPQGAHSIRKIKNSFPRTLNFSNWVLKCPRILLRAVEQGGTMGRGSGEGFGQSSSIFTHLWGICVTFCLTGSSYCWCKAGPSTVQVRGQLVQDHFSEDETWRSTHWAMEWMGFIQPSKGR